MDVREQPLVSILTPVYNGEPYLAECIESVLTQTYSNWEYTIVNNNSTDGTQKVAEEYAKKDSRIQVHKADVLVDVIANHNRAFRLISPKSKYCKVVSGDDFLFPECVTRMVELAEAHPSIGFIGSYQLSGGGDKWYVRNQGLPYHRSFVPGLEVGRSQLLGKLDVLGAPTSDLYRSDLVRGEVEFPNRATEDFICVKGNGKPLFALANVVDDRTMAITHVFRGEEHLPNTPKQMMLWWALNEATGLELPLPAFAHLPLLVNEQGKKLSKRRDPVAVEMYREQGYLPSAFRNYLALLGWSPGEEEIVPLATLIERFRIEDVQRSPAFFDVKKLTHMNGVYIRELATPEFIEMSLPWVHPEAGAWAAGDWSDPDTGTSITEGPRWPAARFDPVVFTRIAPVVQERVSVLGEVPAMVDFLFLEDPPIDPDSWQKAIAGDEVAPLILRAALEAYGTCGWTRDELHEVTAQIGEANGRALGKAQAPIRVAVTGRRVGPPLFESLEVLGRDETRRRIAAALERLAADG